MPRPFKRTNRGPRPTTATPLIVEALESRTLLSSVPLGGNLNQQTDRIQDHPFVDLVKVTRGFYNASGNPAPTDAGGWPTQDFSFSADDQSEYGVQVTPGTYHLSFTGPAGVSVTTLASAPGPRSGPAIVSNTGKIALVPTGYNAATGLHTENVVVPSHVYTIAFNFNHTGGQVKNIHLTQPGYDPNNHPVYTTTYVNFLKNLGPNVLRFMDYTVTQAQAQDNQYQVSNWSDRTLPGDATGATKGVAWEDCIALANAERAGVWLNVPVAATDDYVRQLATLLKNTLSPAVPIYIEYSNEVWNYSFSQHAYNKAQAAAEVQSAARAGRQSDLNYDHLSLTAGGSADVWALRRYARRSLQISNIFKGVWTGAGLPSPINSRVRVVLGGQAAVLSSFDTALKYVSSEYGAPRNYFYALGVGPYVQMNKYADQYGAPPDVTASQALQGFSLSIDHYQSTGVFPQAVAKAASWGLKLDAYEAGEDTYGPLNIAAKAAAVVDPRNTAIMERFLHLWYASGGDQLNWYTLGARTDNTQYGSWSISTDINDYNQPKEQAFVAVRNGG